MVKTENLTFKYSRINQKTEEKEYFPALSDLSLTIEKSEFVTVLGHNGSGKSTLARHLNALLLPTEGKVFIKGLDTSIEDNIWLIRQSAGMVFQNPDNQIIATIVEEDIAFGPENLGIPSDEIRKRVDECLKSVQMDEFRRRAPNLLSGGQKQRVAIAGVLAMRPEIIVLDEATAMLDPVGRKEIMAIVKRLNKEEGMTVIHITHYMEEAVEADRVIVMNDGNVVMDGIPKEVFRNIAKLKALGLDVPQVTELTHRLIENGITLPDDIITLEEGVEILAPLLDFSKPSETAKNPPSHMRQTTDIIELKDVSHIYSPGTVFEKAAITDISFTVKKGEFFGIIGHTGSGKSTLIQHLNGLIKPTSGQVIVEGEDINGDKAKLRSVRQKVGLVFQYPENQLFEMTVFADVAFGPKNMGFDKAEINRKVRRALSLVGISEEYFDKSPFELSGGQKRRVAIAGVLAMEPEILVMDEPTAGLDPKGRDEIFVQIKELHKELGNTVIIVSHSMEDIARLCERIGVFAEGRLQYLGTPEEIFKNAKELEKIGLAAPQINYLIRLLNEKGAGLNEDIYTIDAAYKEIFERIR
ncbi:MAG: energy-coupling factor transporter ATPase [Defluviitaleaceae bacterium]|nr:energy-coupling factor transporter ATPase [Defluviitaleaceae bacterium]